MSAETSTEASAGVREILRARGASSDALTEHAELGSNGLGLDSISIAEVLLDCEKRFGVPFADLLDGNPITVASLIARAER
ncbi:MAG TPA: phosphopantetheine-binding protein [Thermoanaerobaculia bacterium]